MLVFGTTLMEPILAVPAPGVTILQAYIVMNAAAQSPYDYLYKDLFTTIIMIKNCGFNSLRKWMAQHHMSPNGQTYPTSSNDLVEMINSGNFEPYSFKPRSKRFNRNKKNKKKEEKDKETVREIVESIPNIPTMDKPDPVEDAVPDSDNDESIDGDSDTSSKGDDSSKEDRKPGGMFPINVQTLCTFSWHGYAQTCKKSYD